MIAILSFLCNDTISKMKRRPSKANRVERPVSHKGAMVCVRLNLFSTKVV
jgi:hypothetical protein